jgi:hypothetical protein
MNICISLDTENDCDLLHDTRPLNREVTPGQNCNCLDYNQNLVMSPGGGSKPRLTD